MKRVLPSFRRARASSAVTPAPPVKARAAVAMHIVNTTVAITVIERFIKSPPCLGVKRIFSKRTA